MAQLFSQALIFAGIVLGVATIVGLGIALFQLRVLLRRDPTAKREARAAGDTPRGAVRLALNYLIVAVGNALLAWFVLEVAWIIASNIYNAFVPVYPDCYPTLTDVYACSPSIAVQNDVDLIIQVCAALFGLCKGVAGLGARSKTSRPPALPSEGGSTT
jgi:hypothetical protein